MSILDELRTNKIIQNGDFVLKSGKKSDTYINLKNIISFPSLHQKVCKALEWKILTESSDLICGTPYGAISFASYISIDLNLPMILLRKEQKDYGTKKIIEGVFEKNQKVVLIEDVITTGESVIQAAKKIEEHGLVVSKIISVFSRNSNLNLMYGKVPIEYLFHINDMKKKEITEIIKEKNSPICLAADVDTVSELFSLIKSVGKYICILKLHSDIIKDFWSNYTETRDTLNKMKLEYNFKIWEDRKFADIGHIMNRQVHTCISEWADIVSVHPIAGKKSLYQIKDIDIILIAEMSSDGHIMSPEYQIRVMEMAYGIKNVIGIVCQHKFSCPSQFFFDAKKLLHIVPGISLDGTTDNKGQTYSSPEDRSFADIYVIGRAITQAEDPELAIQEIMSKINK